jgi:membrane-associated phospholipid phosphatase
MKKSFRQVLKETRFVFVPFLAVLFFGLIIKLLYSKDDIYWATNSIHFPLADKLAPYFTNAGDGLTTIAIVVILVLFNYRWAFLLATSYAITSLLAQVVKHIVDAPRPLLYFKGHTDKMYLVKGVYIASYNSFPSGHTLTAFSTAIVLTYIAKNKGWGLPLFIIAVLIGYSRMYLSEHFLEDVLGGSFIGVSVTLIWLWFIDNKRFLHTPAWNRGLLKRN